MKKFLLTITVVLLASISLFSQAPQGFKYQAIVRNSIGLAVANQDVTFQISILEGSAMTEVYTQTTDTATNAFGLVNLQIGDDSNDFKSIKWGENDYYVKIVISYMKGEEEISLDMGTSQLLSVPYALYGADEDADPKNELQDLSIDGNTISLSGSDQTIDLPPDDDGSPTNEIQNLRLTGNVLSLDNTSSTTSAIVDLGNYVNDADANPTNEIQNLKLTGNVLSLDNTSTATSAIIDLGDYIDDADADPTNEIQNLKLTGNVLSLDNTSSTTSAEVDLSNYIDDADADPTNEIQGLKVTNNTLSIDKTHTATSVPIDTDPANEIQGLKVTNNTLSIDVTHTATSVPIDTDPQNEMQYFNINPTENTLSLDNTGSTSIPLVNIEPKNANVTVEGTYPNFKIGIIPQMTQAEIGALTPEILFPGLMVFNTSNELLTYYNGHDWIDVCFPPPTSAMAGDDDQGCELVATTATIGLTANTPSEGTGMWSIVSGTGGTLANISTHNSNFTGNLNETYVLRWTIQNRCGSSTDDVEIKFVGTPPAAIAGGSQTVAPDSFDPTVNLNAVMPTTDVGYWTARWSVMAGNADDSNFSDVYDDDAVFTGKPGETYSLRWMVYNNCKTNKSDITITFTNQCPGQATVDHLDQSNINTIVINDRCWLTENIKVGAKVNADVYTQTLTDQSFTPYYLDNNDPNYDDYGGLYTWGEIINEVSLGKKICPDNWHVPTKNEWQDLIDYFGGNAVAGNALKTTDVTYWTGNAGSDASGLGFKGGGFWKDNGTWGTATDAIYLWTSTPFSGAPLINANFVRINQDGTVVIDNNPQTDAYYVRCIKDE